MKENKDLYIENNVLIENAIAKYYDDKNDENLTAVIESVRQRMHEEGHILFSVPEDANEDHQSQFNTITDDEGNKWILVFTSKAEFDKCEFGTAKSHSIDWTLKISLENGFAGLVINPWGQYFMLTREHMETIFNEDGDLEYYISTDTITPDTPQDGTLLKKAISIFKRNATEMNFNKICMILLNSKVWIPCRTDKNETSIQMNEDLNELTLGFLLNDNSCNLPVFSSAEEMGEFCEGLKKKEKPMIDVLDFVDDADEITGIKVDPFTESIFIPRKMFKFLRVVGVSFENGVFTDDKE